MKNTLQSINNAVLSDPVGFIESVEAEYRGELSSLAKRIADNDDIRLVAIAGPSGSGKTTTAKLLSELLERLDERNATVSLDDFYLPASEAPVLEDGTRDTESVNALDLKLIGSCFKQVISTGSGDMPVYNFKTSSREPFTRKIDVGKRGIVIIEGLHAINPVLTGLIPPQNICRVYISVNSPITDGNGGILLTSRAVRLMRRALRDEIFRGADINTTLAMWNAVGEGERKYLFKYKDTADVRLKTLHSYEPCVYKERFLNMRAMVGGDTPCAEYFMRTAAAVEKFVSLDKSLVPKNSLLREFIGDKV